MTCPDHAFRLELLPKGSTCKSFKDVPARSDYWREDTDTVTRCERFKGERDQRPTDDDEGDSGESEPSVSYDEPPKEVNGWVRGVNKSYDDGQPKKVTYEAVTTAGSPATVPQDETVTAVVTVLSHGGNFKHRYSARVKYTWREGTEGKSKTTQLSTAKGSGKPARNWNRVLGKTVEWMNEHDPDTERGATADDVGKWEKVGDLAWKTEYSDPMLGGKVEHRVRIITDEHRGDTWHVVQQKGPRHDEWKRLTAEESEDGAIEEAQQWMDDHPPSHFEYEIPAEVNGWERVEKDDSEIAYETWVAPTLGRPTAVKRHIRAFRGKKGGWHPRGKYVDGDGNEVSSYDPDQFRTSSSSMTGRSSGSIKKLPNPRRAMDVLTDVMEDVDPERVEYTNLPRFDVRFENDTTKPPMKVLERFAVDGPADANRTRHAVGAVADDGALDIKGTDSANVVLYDLSLLFSAAESVSIDREGSPFAFDGVAFAEPFTDANMGADARIYTEYPDGQNELPNLVVEVGGAERRVYMHPNAEPATAEIPDLPVGASFTVPEANPFKKATRFTAQVNDHAAVVVTDDEAYMVSEGDSERRRGKLTETTRVEDDDRVFGFYSLDYLRDFSKDVPRPASTELSFRLTTPEGFDGVTGPMFFSWDSRGGMVTLLLAPRIKGTDDDEGERDPTGGWDLSAPVCLSSTVPVLTRQELPATAYSSLRDAWQGFKISLAKGQDEQAKQFAAIINGIRAGHGFEPITFDALDGFSGVAEF